MQLHAMLMDARPDLLDEAFTALRRSHVSHYEAAGEEVTRQRLDELLSLVIATIESRDLAALSAHCERIAEDRFNQGFDISEVQAAFNALEEAMWRLVVGRTPAEDLPEAIGLVGTVLGYGKDTVARRYVSLAAKRHVPTLDLSALFAGVNS